MVTLFLISYPILPLVYVLIQNARQNVVYNLPVNFVLLRFAFTNANMLGITRTKEAQQNIFFTLRSFYTIIRNSFSFKTLIFLRLRVCFLT